MTKVKIYKNPFTKKTHETRSYRVTPGLVAAKIEAEGKEDKKKDIPQEKPELKAKREAVKGKGVFLPGPARFPYKNPQRIKKGGEIKRLKRK